MVFLDHSSYQHLQGLVRWSGKSQGRSSISACSFLIWSYRVGASSISLVQVYQQWDLDMCKTTRFHLKFIASCLSMGKLIFINQLIMTKNPWHPHQQILQVLLLCCSSFAFNANLFQQLLRSHMALTAAAVHVLHLSSTEKHCKTEQHIEGNDMLICDFWCFASAHSNWWQPAESRG